MEMPLQSLHMPTAATRVSPSAVRACAGSPAVASPVAAEPISGGGGAHRAVGRDGSSRALPPLLLFHGVRDRVVPIAIGRRLRDSLPVALEARFVEAARHGHEDAFASDEVQVALRALWAELHPPSSPRVLLEAAVDAAKSITSVEALRLATLVLPAATALALTRVLKSRTTALVDLESLS